MCKGAQAAQLTLAAVHTQEEGQHDVGEAGDEGACSVVMLGE